MFTRVINRQLRLIGWALLGAPALALLAVAGCFRFDPARPGFSGLQAVCVVAGFAAVATGMFAFYKATRESTWVRVMFTAGYTVVIGCVLAVSLFAAWA